MSCWEASLLTRAGTRSSAFPQWNSTLLNSAGGTATLLGPGPVPAVLKALTRGALGKHWPGSVFALPQAHWVHIRGRVVPSAWSPPPFLP